MDENALFLDQDAVKQDLAVGKDSDQIPVYGGAVAVVTLIVCLPRGEVNRADFYIGRSG